MIRYRKGAEPEALAAYRATDGADWKGFAGRQAVREALVRDQGALCAYCQRRIKPTIEMKIDHWLPRSDPDGGKAGELLWHNLVGACRGVTSGGIHGTSRHCDTSRGDRPTNEQRLHLHPVEGRGPDPRTHVRYQANGAAFAFPPNPAVDNDLALLNLNCEYLRESRSQIIARLEERLKMVGFTPAQVQKLLDELEATPATPFIAVARDYLRRKLRRLS